MMRPVDRGPTSLSMTCCDLEKNKREQELAEAHGSEYSLCRV